MVDISITILLYISFLVFCLKRIMTYLHILQQEEYYTGRFFDWVIRNFVIDKRVTLILGILGAAGLFIPPEVPPFALLSVTFLVLIVAAYLEKDPRKRSKKRLNLTSRTQRIFTMTFICMMVIGALIFFIPHPWTLIIGVQMLLPCLLISNVFLAPVEDAVQKMYWNEARAKMKRLENLKVIAITGSFGKTSVKHILGHILKIHAKTLITPGSVNTPMGITRIIREELTEDHEYFIVEMGAYGKGSIRKLCELTPPHMGMITAIGHAHYERFKSLDTVAEAKFELAEAVLKNDGKIVIHEKTLRYAHARKFKNQYAANFIVCGDAPPASAHKGQKQVSYIGPNDLQIQKIQQHAKALEVRMTWKGAVYILEVPLYGLHHGHNAALAFAMALELGIEASSIHAALRTLPQIEHRLEVKKVDDVTIIDDAYNSNPLGFRSALDLMDIIKSGGRNILVTPGIVELGIAHNDAHQKLGIYAGEVCDVIVVVKPDRIPTFIEGFKSSGASKQIVEVPSFEKAQEWLEKNQKPGDVILLENDLPDVYENIPKI